MLILSDAVDGVGTVGSIFRAALGAAALALDLDRRFTIAYVLQSKRDV